MQISKISFACRLSLGPLALPSPPTTYSARGESAIEAAEAGGATVGQAPAVTGHLASVGALQRPLINWCRVTAS